MNKIALIDIAERVVRTFIQATGAALATGAGESLAQDAAQSLAQDLRIRRPLLLQRTRQITDHRRGESGAILVASGAARRIEAQLAGHEGAISGKLKCSKASPQAIAWDEGARCEYPHSPSIASQRKSPGLLRGFESQSSRCQFIRGQRHIGTDLFRRLSDFQRRIYRSCDPVSRRS